MNTDIRNIRLIRNVIRDQKENIYEENADRETFGDNDTLFATDYFDILKAEKKEVTDPLSDIIGIWPREYIDADNIAVQSYSLYYSEKMFKIDKKRKIEHIGDPFATQNYNDTERLPYLSIIQVHITPEILAHGLKKKSAHEFINSIFNDLHEIIGVYLKKNEKIPLIFRIYKMISVGDFAVVIRSQKAEISFQISTLIRQRTASCNNSGNNKPLVIYKTYTLLTLAENVIEVDKGDENLVSVEKNDENCYVLRCCYSNLYWSGKQRVEKFLKEKQFSFEHEVYGLNGRYDFSVYITEREFLDLFPYIREYKEKGKSNYSGTYLNGFAEEQLGNEICITDYIKYLLKNNYLSYINERYLLTSDSREKNLEDIHVSESKYVEISKESIISREDFLDSKISGYYKKVLKNYEEAYKAINQIKAYRKNMKHYMYLLKKLIILCQGINGFSDTRIYAIVLLEQLDVVIDSIVVYVELLKEEENEIQILELLEDYIRESVYALDCYAQYIRNNNLQSLQTPNYNLESNTSMEKILIGYSEFLRVFTEFYQKEYSNINGTQRQYLPVLIPAMFQRDMSVEVMFPEGVKYNWREEEKIRSEFGNEKNRYCMIISIPTLIELGKVMTMMPSLFHEIAHQFRYEKRGTRNDTLIKYSARIIMNILSKGVVDRLRRETGCYDLTWNLEDILKTYFLDAYLETNYETEKKGEYSYSFQNTPLNTFLVQLEDDMNKKLSYWGKEEEIEFVLQEFTKGVSQYYYSENETYKKGILLLDTLVRKLKNKGKYKILVRPVKKKKCHIKLVKSKRIEIYSHERQINRIVKCAYGIAWECACRNIGRDERLWEEKEFTEWVKQEDSIQWYKTWIDCFNKDEPYGISENNKVWNMFFRFSTWVYDELKTSNDVEKFDDRSREKFIEVAYQKACDGWSEEVKRDDLEQDPNNNLESMGRALGIDMWKEENYSVFKEIMESEIDKYRDDMIEKMHEMICEYREETADLFMCNAMNLKPFAYMNILAVNWPNDLELPEAYFNRSLDVLIFQWCLKKGEAGQVYPDYRRFQEISVEILNKLKEEISCILGVLTEKGKIVEDLNLNGDLVFYWDGDSEAEVISVLDNADKLLDLCIRMEEAIKEQKENMESQLLKSYEIICRMMQQLIEYSKERFDYLEEYSELRMDYITGVKELESLNKKMCKSRDLTVRELGKFCKEISKFLDNPYQQFQNKKKYARLNKKSIEFLIHMYYINKRRNAQKLGRKNNVN